MEEAEGGVKALPDASARLRAASSFERSVVVTASAGTGKTTLLVERALHLVLGRREAVAGLRLPVLPRELLAVTFGEKAAGEMRSRLREALLGLAGRGGDAPEPRRRWLEEAAARIGEVSGRSGEDLRALARALLPSLEEAKVTTLHSLAAEILRAFPAEAGVDPRFAVDEGPEHRARFDKAWDRFLATAPEEPGRRERWLRLLDRVEVGALRDLAEALATWRVPDGELHRIFERPASRPFAEWLGERRLEARRLADLARRTGEDRVVERAALGAEKVLEASAAGEDAAAAEAAGALEGLEVGAPPKGWEKTDADRVKGVLRTARGLAGFDAGFAEDLRETLVAFARDYRRDYLRAGWVSFDALLSLARDLLLRRPEARRALQRRYRAILVDEFQDTDPMQGEIVMLLAEREGGSAGSGREVDVSPGKLFLVGDDKQSIYSFRGADLDACTRVRDRILEEGGRETLRTSFRSDPRILSAVNGLFGRLFEAGRFQPGYEPLEPRPGAALAPVEHPVEFRVWRGAEGPLGAEEAARAEAESVAEALREYHAEGIPWRSMAVLFRAFSRAHIYLGALQRRGVPYASEGEKFFHAVQEVVDFVNLLAAIADPDDQLALAGVLRSPLGALEDRSLVLLAAAGGLDSRRDPPAGLPFALAVSNLYEAIRASRDEAARRPLGEFLASLFERFPLLELAGAAYRGEQAAANLDKIRGIARRLAEGPGRTLPRLVAELRRLHEEGIEEGEAPRFEESVDAVRVLTIHKAKGLEFDVVVLPACHSGTKRGNGENVWARFDWAAEAAGLRLGRFRTPAAVFLEERDLLRREAERVRLFYVGATRARSRLLLSAVEVDCVGPVSFLRAFEKATGSALLALAGDGGGPTRVLEAGSGRILVRFAPLAAPARPARREASGPGTTGDAAAMEEEWAAREAALRLAEATPLLSAAGALASEEDEPFHDRGEEDSPPAARALHREPRRLIGTLCHRALERWDFAASLGGLGRAVREVAAAEGLDGEAFGAALAESETVLRAFLGSDLGKVMRKLKILGREVPILVQASGRTVHGFADLVAEESDGSLLLVDYKTDSVGAAEAAKRGEAYRAACGAYAEGLRSAFPGRTVRAALYFLRPAVRVDLPS